MDPLAVQNEDFGNDGLSIKMVIGFPGIFTRGLKLEPTDNCRLLGSLTQI
jgi:hypothetical protein